MSTVPGLGKQKINSRVQQGPAVGDQTLKENFNVDIQHYLEVNFRPSRTIVNAVGSVPVYFPYRRAIRSPD